MPDSYQIPSVVPAMTLQNTVLFPKVIMPLKIFENRYQEMLSDVLTSNRMFAVVCQREKKSG